MYKVYSKFNFPFTSLVEVWKDVPEWEGCYQVSSFGRVRSKDKVRIKSRNGVTFAAPYAGRIMAQKISKSGYAVVGFKDVERTKHPSVHRLVALAFIPNGESKPTVNHVDTVKLNNNVANLEWSTHSEQMQHASVNDLLEVRGAPKYSPAFKQKVLEHHSKTGISLIALAREFNISERTAGRIVSGQISREHKIPEEEISNIIKLRESGWTLKSISEKYNCGISQIHRITKGMSRNVQYERN